ncbi:hypothetical protein [Thalassotalea agarivorans]|uniref:Uncharacterized protein n=1 Tax=Thalassotalea agarivorans TaxID=349064 RepID=A0A1I0CSB5_THASX|nr:hypothetical protein [Thalassotalea agarivorans]SET22632.1 hypothetical protein SAMN05660429_01311 [Thalassotalea agarivorans]
MEEHAIKIKRSNVAIKLAMMFIIVFEGMRIYQSGIVSMGSIATNIGLLSLLRGLLLSSLMFSTPTRDWFKQNVGMHKDSYKYFLVAIVLLAIGSIRFF